MSKSAEKVVDDEGLARKRARCVSLFKQNVEPLLRVCADVLEVGIAIVLNEEQSVIGVPWSNVQAHGPVRGDAEDGPGRTEPETG